MDFEIRKSKSRGREASADDMISNYPRRGRHGIACHTPYLNQRFPR
ncbi:hypothetical protein [Streptomyces sp. 4N124]